MNTQKNNPDELNPNYLFSCTWTDLLSKIAKGEVNAIELAKKELGNRGLDINGNWVGFKNKIN